MQDFYQQRNVYVNAGRFGESLFAKRAMKNGTVLAYHSGLKVLPDRTLGNLTKEERYSFDLLTYRITSNNSRGNYQFFTFFPAGIIRGRELLEVLKLISCYSQLQL